MQLCIEPIAGQPVKQIDIAVMREVAPSVRVDEKFPDGSVNVIVHDEEADALTDKLESVGYKYKIL